MSIEVYETMSTATMWLLLFVVAALALLIAALTKTKFTVQKISIIGIMAAMSFVAYEFFRIPNVFGTGSSFHLGNTFTALTAMLLDVWPVPSAWRWPMLSPVTRATPSRPLF